MNECASIQINVYKCVQGKLSRLGPTPACSVCAMYDITILFDWIPGGQVEIFRSLIFKVNGQMNH